MSGINYVAEYYHTLRKGQAYFRRSTRISEQSTDPGELVGEIEMNSVSLESIIKINP